MLQIIRLELALKEAMLRKPFYILWYLTMKRKSTALEANNFTVANENSNYQATSRMSSEWFTALELDRMDSRSEIVDENWEIKSQWLWILGENYENAKTIIDDFRDMAKRLVEKLENSKPKTKKLGSKMENFTAFDKNLDEIPENLMAIYQNQLYDLRKNDISLEHLAWELTFFDFFMRIANWEPVNFKYVARKNLQNLVKIWKEFVCFQESTVENSENETPFRKSRDFKRILGTEQTPNERNYEQKLIQKLTFKRMLDEMELLDWKKLAIIRENLENIEYLKQQYREMIVDNWLSPRKQKIELKKYQKQAKKMLDKNLYNSYYLRQKYGYMLEN